MEEENKKEKRKISLVTYVLSLIAMALIATLFIVLSLNNKENKNVKELNNTVQPNTTTIEQTEITPEVTKEITPEVTTNTTNEKTEENFNGDYTNKIDENAGGSLSIKNYNADEFEFQLSLYRGTNAPKTANLEGKAKKISDNKYVYEEEKDEYAYKLNFELLKNNDNIVIELKEEGYDKNSKKEFETHPENNTGLSYDGKYNKEEIKLVQFDNKFNTIKAIAQEDVSPSKLGDIQNLEYDLDGDGIKEKITIKPTKTDDGAEEQYAVQLNGKTFFDRFENTSIWNVYIADLNKDDKTTEIVIYDDGPSDDPHHRIFSKIGTEMKELCDISGYPLYISEKGEMAAVPEHNAKISPIVFNKSYVFENNSVKENKLDLSKVKDIEFSCEDGLFTTDLKNIEKYNGENSKEYSDNEEGRIKRYKDSGIEVLKSTDKFTVIEFISDGLDIKVKFNGKEGYILGNHFSD